MSSYRILNTRPTHQADSLTHLIENKGGFVFNLPVFEIQSIEFDIKTIDDYDYIIFLSANAVKHFFKKNCQTPSHVIAIGPATKFALEKMGVKKVFMPTQFSSDGILSLREMQSIQNKKMAIICGENSKSHLPNALKKCGAKVISIICYRRNPIIYDMNIIFQKLIGNKINVIVSTSLESYFALLSLFQYPEHRAWLLQNTICVINDEMRQQATLDGFSRVIQANNATSEAIVAAIY